MVLVIVLGAAACSGSSGGSAATPSPGSTHMVAAPLSSPSPSTARPSRLRARVVGRLAQPASRTVAVRDGRRLLLLGGLTSGDVTTGHVVAVDPRTWHGRVVGTLREPVHDAAGALVGGVPLVFGGGAATEVADVQAWSGRTSRIVGRLPIGRSDSAAAVVAGTAYIVGGFDGSTLLRDVVATRDGRTFHVAGELRQGVRYPAVAAYDGAVWICGGELATTEGTSGGPETDAIQRFDPVSGKTRIVGRLPHVLGHAMAFTLHGSLYVAGGRRAGVAQRTIWRIDVTRGRAVRAGHLPIAESDAAVVTGASRTWLIGGETSGPLAPQTSIIAVR